MASRRSRLQIKPNLGPKVGAKGSTTKPSDTEKNDITDGQIVSNKAQTSSVNSSTESGVSQNVNNNKQVIQDRTVKEIQSVQQSDLSDSTSVDVVISSENTDVAGKNDRETEFTLLKNLDAAKSGPDAVSNNKKEETSSKKPPIIRNRLPKAKPNIPSRSGPATVRPQKSAESSDILPQPLQPAVQQSQKTEKDIEHESKEESENRKQVEETVKVKSADNNTSLPSDRNTTVSAVSYPPAPVPVTPEKKSGLNEVTASPQKPVIIRNRLPKAKPNLTDITRNRRPLPSSPAHGYTQSPLKSPMKSPVKSVRPSFSPMKAVRDLSTLESVPEIIEKSQDIHQDVGPAVDSSVLSQENMQQSDQQGDKRNRSMSMSEAAAVKPRYKRPKLTLSVDEPADRSKMKMSELIYWNPSRNPMKQKTSDTNKRSVPSTPVKTNQALQSKENNTRETENIDKEMDENEDMPAPQVKIGPHGEIILNEASLVIENNDPIIEDDDPIIDETDSFVTYASFRAKRTRSYWGEKETEKFYKALSHIGTDFSLMKKVFPHRSRIELKQKFRQEDRKNRHLIEKALSDKKPFSQKIIDEMVLECDGEGKKQKKEIKEKKNTDNGTESVEIEEENENSENREKKAEKQKRIKKSVNYYEDPNDVEMISSKTEKSKSGRTVKRRYDSSFVKDFEDTDKYPVASWFKVPEEKEKDRGEVVDILVNMSEGKIPRTSKSKPTTGKKSNSLSTVATTTSEESSSELPMLHVSSLSNTNSETGPFILVYSKDPKAGPDAETVIHVYRLQGDELGNFNGNDVIAGSSNSEENSGKKDSNLENVPNNSVTSVPFNLEGANSNDVIDTVLQKAQEESGQSPSQESLVSNVEKNELFIPFIPPSCQTRQDTVSPDVNSKIEESMPLDDDNVIYVDDSGDQYDPRYVKTLLPQQPGLNNIEAVHVEYTNTVKTLQDPDNSNHKIPEENINYIEVSDVVQIDETDSEQTEGNTDHVEDTQYSWCEIPASASIQGVTDLHITTVNSTASTSTS